MLNGFSTKIAMRYIHASRESRFFSWIAWLSASGVAIGVAAMIVVLSVINGFEIELRNRFLAANAHVLLYRFPAGLVDYGDWEKTVRKDFSKDITGVSPFVHYETMARAGSIMNSVMVRGVVPKSRKDVQDMSTLVRPATGLDVLQAEVDLGKTNEKLPDVPSVIIGSGLLSILDLKVGSIIELVSPEESSFGDVAKFRIAGIYDSGLKHYDNRIVIMSLPVAQRFFSMGEKVTGIEVGLKEPDNSPAIASKMQELYSISIKEWQSFNKSLFDAMKMERAVIGMIVALVAIVASFNILTTLFVSVSQKQKDISILKACGSTNRQIMRIFLKQGVLIGSVGSTMGTILALGISWLIERYHFVDLPDLYLIATLPIAYDWKLYLAVALGGLLGCVLASIYPAAIGAKISPVDGLRGSTPAG
jgi:lipoprotein-releasing system permease protein